MKLQLKKTSIALAVAIASGTAVAAEELQTRWAYDDELGNAYQQTSGTYDPETKISKTDESWNGEILSQGAKVKGALEQETDWMGTVSDYQKYSYQEIRKGTLVTRDENKNTSNDDVKDETEAARFESKWDESEETGQVTRTANTRIQLDAVGDEVSGTEQRRDDTTFAFAADDVNTVVGAQQSHYAGESETVYYNNETSEDGVTSSKNASGILSSDSSSYVDTSVNNQHLTDENGNVVAFKLNDDKTWLQESTVESRANSFSNENVQYDDTNVAGLSSSYESQSSSESTMVSAIDGFETVDNSTSATHNIDYNDGGHELASIRSGNSTSETKDREFVRDADNKIVLSEDGQLTVATETQANGTSEQYTSRYQPTHYTTGDKAGQDYELQNDRSGWGLNDTRWTDSDIQKSVNNYERNETTTHQADGFVEHDNDKRINTAEYARNQQEHIEVDRDLVDSRLNDSKRLSQRWVGEDITEANEIKPAVDSQFDLGSVRVDASGNEFDGRLVSEGGDVHAWVDETGAERHYVVIGQDADGNDIRSEVSYTAAQPAEYEPGSVQDIYRDTVNTFVDSQERTDKVTMGEEVAYHKTEKEQYENTTALKDGNVVLDSNKSSNETDTKVYSIGQNELDYQRTEVGNSEVVSADYDNLTVATDAVVINEVTTTKNTWDKTAQKFQSDQAKASFTHDKGTYDRTITDAAGAVQTYDRNTSDTATTIFRDGQDTLASIVDSKGTTATKTQQFNYDAETGERLDLASETVRDTATEQYTSTYQPGRYTADDEERGIVAGDAYQIQKTTWTADTNQQKTLRTHTENSETTHTVDGFVEHSNMTTVDNAEYARNQQENIEVDRDLLTSQVGDSKSLNRDVVLGSKVVTEESLDLGSIAVKTDGSEITNVETWTDEAGVEHQYVVLGYDLDGQEIRSEVTFTAEETAYITKEVVTTANVNNATTEKVMMGEEVAYHKNQTTQSESTDRLKDSNVILSSNKSSKEVDTKAYSIGQNALNHQRTEAGNSEQMTTHYELDADDNVVVTGSTTTQTAWDKTVQQYQAGQEKQRVEHNINSSDVTNMDAAGHELGYTRSNGEETYITYQAGQEKQRVEHNINSSDMTNMDAAGHELGYTRSNGEETYTTYQEGHSDLDRTIVSMNTTATKVQDEFEAARTHIRPVDEDGQQIFAGGVLAHDEKGQEVLSKAEDTIATVARDTVTTTAANVDEKVYQTGEVAYQIAESSSSDAMITYEDGSTGYDKSANSRDVTLYSHGEHEKYRDAMMTESTASKVNTYELNAAGEAVVTGTEESKRNKTVVEANYQAGHELEKSSKSMMDSSFEKVTADATSTTHSTKNEENLTYQEGQALATSSTEQSTASHKFVTADETSTRDTTDQREILNYQEGQALQLSDKKASTSNEKLVTADATRTDNRTSNVEGLVYQAGQEIAESNTAASTRALTVENADGTGLTYNTSANANETIYQTEMGLLASQDVYHTTSAESTESLVQDGVTHSIMRGQEDVQRSDHSATWKNHGTETMVAADGTKTIVSKTESAQVDKLGTYESSMLNRTEQHIAADGSSTTTSKTRAENVEGIVLTSTMVDATSTATQETKIKASGISTSRIDGNGENGALVLHGGTNSTTQTLDDNGVSFVSTDASGKITGATTIDANGKLTVQGVNIKSGGEIKIGNLVLNGEAGLNAGNQAITGVAAGTADTDAANVAQVNNVKTTLRNEAAAETTRVNTALNNETQARIAGDTATLNSANAYTNTRVNQLNNRVDDVQKTAYRGIAIALAAQQAVPNINPGQVAVFGGVGHYEGETAGSIGVVTSVTDRISASGAFGFASGNEFGGRVGVAYVFGGK